MKYEMIYDHYDGKTTYVYKIEGTIWVSNGCQTFPLDDIEDVAARYDVSKEQIRILREVAGRDLVDMDAGSIREMMSEWGAMYYHPSQQGAWVRFVDGGAPLYAIEAAYIAANSFSLEQNGRNELWFQMCKIKPELLGRLPEDVNALKVIKKVLKENPNYYTYLSDDLLLSPIVEGFASVVPHMVVDIPENKVTYHAVRSAVSEDPHIIKSLRGRHKEWGMMRYSEMIKERVRGMVNEECTGLLHALYTLPPEDVKWLISEACGHLAHELNGEFGS